MAKTTINNQSIFDLAIQLHGNVEQAFALALQNGYSVTDVVPPGTVITPAEDRTYHDTEVANYFDRKNQKIATASAIPEGSLPDSGGIGYMIIEEDFIVR